MKSKELWEQIGNWPTKKDQASCHSSTTLTRILDMAAILSGSILGTLLSCGKTGKGETSASDGDADINSEKYNSASDLENSVPCRWCQIEELVEVEIVSGNKLEQHMSIPNLFCICKCTLYSHCITLAICFRILVFIELRVSETRSICPGDFVEQTSNKYLLSLRTCVKRFITSASYLL